MSTFSDAKLHRKLFVTPILITAGPDAVKFNVHLEILLTSSPFFAAAYNPSYTFKDSPSEQSIGQDSHDFNKLSLPTISPDDFEYFIQWLYTRTLDHEELTGPHPAYFRLLRLYGLADQLQIPALKNCIIDEMAVVADRTNSCPTPDDTRTAWDDESGCGTNHSYLLQRHQSGVGSTASMGAGDQAGVGSGGEATEGEGGGIRELISDLFAWKKTDKLLAEHADPWDETFLREVIVKLKTEKSRGDKAPWRDRTKACRRYHVHDEWAPACMEL